MRERTNFGQGCSFSFYLVTKRLYGKEREWSIGQIKTCRKKQHVKLDDMKEKPDLICGKAAVGGNYNSTRDNMSVKTELLQEKADDLERVKRYAGAEQIDTIIGKVKEQELMERQARQYHRSYGAR